MVSYCRLSAEPIKTRQPILHPDAVVVQDSTLLYTMDPFHGIQDAGIGVINTTNTPDEIVEKAGIALPSAQVFTVPATEIVLQHLGRPIPSGALLGAFAAATGQITLDAVVEVLQERFKGKVADGNVAAAQAAYDWVQGRRAPSLEHSAAVPMPMPDAATAHMDASAAPPTLAHTEESSHA